MLYLEWFEDQTFRRVMNSGKREKVLETVVQKITDSISNHPFKVAIDGVDAAGKTCFSNELKALLASRGFNVIQVSVDGFHNPSEVRYKRGRESPEGYYYDSFNYDDLKRYLLNPLGSDGDRLIKTRVFDYQNDTYLNTEYKTALEDSILLFDGVFLLRPQLNHVWDLRIFLDISFEESMKRGVGRGEGDRLEKTRLYRRRYIPGQRIYHREVKPCKLADIVIKNNKVDDPEIVFMKQ